MRVINMGENGITWGRQLYLLEALVTKRARMEQWSLDWTVVRWRSLRPSFPHFYWSRPVPQAEEVQRAVREVDTLRRLAALSEEFSRESSPRPVPERAAEEGQARDPGNAEPDEEPVPRDHFCAIRGR